MSELDETSINNLPDEFYHNVREQHTIKKVERYNTCIKLLKKWFDTKSYPLNIPLEHEFYYLDEEYVKKKEFIDLFEKVLCLQDFWKLIYHKPCTWSYDTFVNYMYEIFPFLFKNHIKELVKTTIDNPNGFSVRTINFFICFSDDNENWYSYVENKELFLKKLFKYAANDDECRLPEEIDVLILFIKRLSAHQNIKIQMWFNLVYCSFENFKEETFLCIKMQHIKIVFFGLRHLIFDENVKKRSIKNVLNLINKDLSCFYKNGLWCNMLEYPVDHLKNHCFPKDLANLKKLVSLYLKYTAFFMNTYYDGVEKNKAYHKSVFKLVEVFKNKVSLENLSLNFQKEFVNLFKEILLSQKTSTSFKLKTLEDVYVNYINKDIFKLLWVKNNLSTLTLVHFLCTTMINHSFSFNELNLVSMLVKNYITNIPYNSPTGRLSENYFFILKSVGFILSYCMRYNNKGSKTVREILSSLDNVTELNDILSIIEKVELSTNNAKCSEFFLSSLNAVIKKLSDLKLMNYKRIRNIFDKQLFLYENLVLTSMQFNETVWIFNKMMSFCESNLNDRETKKINNLPRYFVSIQIQILIALFVNLDVNFNTAKLNESSFEIFFGGISQEIVGLAVLCTPCNESASDNEQHKLEHIKRKLNLFNDTYIVRKLNRILSACPRVIDMVEAGCSEKEKEFKEYLNSCIKTQNEGK